MTKKKVVAEQPVVAAETTPVVEPPKTVEKKEKKAPSFVTVEQLTKKLARYDKRIATLEAASKAAAKQLKKLGRG